MALAAWFVLMPCTQFGTGGSRQWHAIDGFETRTVPPCRWYRHNYTREELTWWAEQIRASGATRVWAYFNNDGEGFAIKYSRMLRRLLKELKG
jgi:uncharacterized protein YecE (DUF72 family)